MNDVEKVIDLLQQLASWERFCAACMIEEAELQRLINSYDSHLDWLFLETG